MKIVQNIKKIRAKNNNSWMRLLEIALEKSPKETLKVLKEIVERDEQVTQQMKKLLTSVDKCDNINN